MTGDDHLIGLGKVVSNLHALEHVLRVFLCEASGERIEYPEPDTSTLSETHLTNYASLDKIIAEYNANLSVQEQIYRVDSTVVKVRDAIAHGRVTSLSTKFPLTLYKFGRTDKNKQIPIEYAEVLTETWFETNRALLMSQIKNVLSCSKSRTYKSLGS